MKVLAFALFLGAVLANDAGNTGDEPDVIDFVLPPAASGEDAAPDDDGSRGDLKLLEQDARLKAGVYSSNSSEVVVLQVDDLCGVDNNLAPFATPSGSGGGSGAYGPANMNDLQECNFYWPSGNSATIQYTWNSYHSITRFVLRTDPYCSTLGTCGQSAVGRGVGSGTVQYWNGLAWVTHGSFSSSSQAIYYYFSSCIYTSAIRIINLATHNCGQQFNPIIYEWSVCECLIESCGTSTNLAPFATPSGSPAGGTGAYGVANMNDRRQCLWYWPSSNSATIQYYWQYPVYVEYFRLYTDPACVANQECSDASSGVGRGVASGTVQYWNGSVWVTDGSFSSTSEIITYSMNTCARTQYLRIINVVTHNCGQNSNPVIYEWQVCSC